jgi:cytochrome c
MTDIDGENGGSGMNKPEVRTPAWAPAAAAAAMMLVAVLAAPAAAVDGDPELGKATFKKCALCHSADAGVNKVGPSLHGIIGRHAAAAEKFNYSPAMKSFDKVWDEQQLAAYLVDPRAVVPGTKMIFPGLKDDQERQNLIAYLKTLN